MVALDPAKDFAGVTLTGASPLVLVANPAFPAHTVADVIAMAKVTPAGSARRAAYDRRTF
jgi:hypothetical protein